MTAMQAPPTVPSQWVVGPAVEPSPPVPGRWIGGAIGVGLALVVAGLGALGVARPLDFGSGVPSLTELGLFGIPAGAILGMAFYPMARRARWVGVVGIGLAVGLLALPIGVLVVVTTYVMGALADGKTDLVGALGSGFFLSLFGFVFSIVAAPITLPIGLVWAIIVRAIPARIVVALTRAAGRPAAS